MVAVDEDKIEAAPEHRASVPTQRLHDSPLCRRSVPSDLATGNDLTPAHPDPPAWERINGDEQPIRSESACDEHRVDALEDPDFDGPPLSASMSRQHRPLAHGRLGAGGIETHEV